MLLKSECSGIIIAIFSTAVKGTSSINGRACEMIEKINCAQSETELLKTLKSALNKIKAGPETGKEYIENNYTKDIFLDSAAEYVNISPSYLSRIFKKNTNVSFTRYIMNLRMEKATEYLKNCNYNIYNISEMVGYSNIYYFYRIFKNKYECTPSEYRKKHQKEKTDEV
jgi:YesN/AraC family two-component response regulator